ncbi:hypothetical protein SEA_PIONEER_79 [Mycobacterium phage Pioneer]|uniref:hypothetical protein n=1 Tax=Mycobacterium phage Pioneer TaxID=1698417 RepID=UPI0006BC3B96|nr:hypothetical protein AVV05_gp030 [Mycobacterium phage Pioneer]ALA07890.1 hypothetical protein SEA_PIONEER_79 [Mycobacterium phage Pioneer]QGJ88729.1 hypothetical protein SEA_BEEMO_79 [Mycobacterium phage Beemo]
MFAEGSEVVDSVFYAQGHAAIGIVKRAGKSAALVEWPDGQRELVDNDELIANPD